MREIEASLDELDLVVEYLNSIFSSDIIIFLRGDLASGKTTLTKAIAKDKGVKSEVTSPTFSLQHCYQDGFYHYDLYRLEYDEFMDLGLFEEFEKSGWHLVEWGSDRLKEFLEGVGYNVATIDITNSPNSRVYRIKNNAYTRS
ncbi:MAG: tRNA (adenosine(37)-N6)-threonylcarbamoyltransferase complex ATPase subunit type 1 TsaE [Sulfurovum sp.]